MPATLSSIHNRNGSHGRAIKENHSGAAVHEHTSRRRPPSSHAVLLECCSQVLLSIILPPFDPSPPLLCENTNNRVVIVPIAAVSLSIGPVLLLHQQISSKLTKALIFLLYLFN
ncbi:unnamed protein product [Linum trigynum]|uniref:Uncharacterized protein n=1 Tax=Linum trigynum TaxID=586398 RepID=A0AAV2GK00_9ROSI